MNKARRRLQKMRSKFRKLTYLPLRASDKDRLNALAHVMRLMTKGASKQIVMMGAHDHLVRLESDAV